MTRNQSRESSKSNTSTCPRRRFHKLLILSLSAAALGGVLTLRSLGQVVAMGIAADGARDRMELAARVDPGSYRIHIALAQDWRRARRCDRAREHAAQARELFPNYPAPGAVLRACRQSR